MRKMAKGGEQDSIRQHSSAYGTYVSMLSRWRRAEIERDWERLRHTKGNEKKTYNERERRDRESESETVTETETDNFFVNGHFFCV